MPETPKDRTTLVWLMKNAYHEATTKDDAIPSEAMEAALRAAEDMGVVPVRKELLKQLLKLTNQLDPGWNSLTTPEEVVQLSAIVMGADIDPFRRSPDD